MINFFLCGCARAAVLLLPFPRLARYFGMFSKTTMISTLISPKQRRRAIRIGSSIRLAAKYTPWDSNCLAQAIVAKFWCSLLNIPCVLYIGFAKSPDALGDYKGHAWITAGPITLTGGNAPLNYQVISSYITKKGIIDVHHFKPQK